MAIFNNYVKLPEGTGYWFGTCFIFPYIAYWCVLRREWMGCWGLLGLLLLVIMDHSRKFPTKQQ